VRSDHSTSLERLRQECLDIRSQVEQSTDTHGSPADDVHVESPSDVLSACDDDDDDNLIARSVQCLGNGRNAAAEAGVGQPGEC